MTNKSHKHSEVIKAWADGADVEYLSQAGNGWVMAGSPNFNKEYKWRVYDKYRELKEAHAKGAVIEFLIYDDVWHVINEPKWQDHTKYRIKPQQLITKRYFHTSILEHTARVFEGEVNGILWDNNEGMSNHLELTFTNGKLTDVQLKDPT